MVVYLKNNFLLAQLVVLFLLISSSHGRFSIKISESDVGIICSKALDHSFCFNFFKSTPQTKTLDLLGTAKIMINYASQDALDIHNQFKSLVKSTVGPKEVYAQCSENYSEAISNFDDALKAVAARDTGTLNSSVSAAMADGDTCKDELSKVQVSPQLLNKMSHMENLSDIVLVISNTY